MLDRDLKNLHGPTGVRKLRLDRLRVGIIFRGKPPKRGLRLRAVLHQAAAPEHDCALQIGRPRRLRLDALRAADEHTGGEIECGIAETKLVHLIALPPEEGIDAGQQLARVKWFRYLR